MNRKKYISGTGAAIGMLFLILDSKTAIEGARAGLELCIRTVIPSLFPFFVLSIALTSSLAGLKIPALRPLGRLCGIPPGSEAILLTGFLGGYPVGAHSVAQANSFGQLKRAQAERMLAFCNNVGPSFLFGIIAGCFPRVGYAWLLWGVHLSSAVLVSIVLPRTDNTAADLTPTKPIAMPEVMKRSLTVMANVCGWVILFRILISILDRWIFWAAPNAVRVLISGLLELTNGCCMLPLIENVGLRFVLCSAMLAFGGLCVTMQTLSVTGSLSSKSYLTGKLIQTIFSIILSMAVQSFFPIEMRYSASPILIAVLAAILGLSIAVKSQKSSSNPMTVGV